MKRLDHSATLLGRLEEEHNNLVDSNNHLTVSQKSLSFKDLGKGRKYEIGKKLEKSWKN